MRICIWLLAVAAALAVAPPLACAQGPLVPPEKHPWARFPPDSWKRVRITRENYDERGVATTSIEEITTTIKAVDANGFTLMTEKPFQVGGRTMVAVRQEVVGYSGETGTQRAESKRLPDSELTLNGRKIPCEVRQAVVNGEGAARNFVTVYYSPEVTPHALRREFAAAEGAPPTTIERVVALGMPYEFLGQRRAAAFVHTFQKLPTKTKETMEVSCDEVPGGVVAHWSKELDANGKLISRSTLELLEYEVKKTGAGAPMLRPRLFDRKRARRAGDKNLMSPSRRER